MKHCQSVDTGKVEWTSSVKILHGIAFHVLECYQIDITKVWHWRTIWLNMFCLKVPYCKLIGWRFSKKDKRILEVLFVGHNATTCFDNLPWLHNFWPPKICPKSVGQGPQSIYLPPHTLVSGFSMTPSDWGRNGCVRDQGVALRQRDRWIWRLQICDALEAGSFWIKLTQLGYSTVLGINQSWAIPCLVIWAVRLGDVTWGIMTGRQTSWSFLLLPWRWLGRNVLGWNGKLDVMKTMWKLFFLKTLFLRSWKDRHFCFSIEGPAAVRWNTPLRTCIKMLTRLPKSRFAESSCSRIDYRTVGTLKVLKFKIDSDSYWQCKNVLFNRRFLQTFWHVHCFY